MVSIDRVLSEFIDDWNAGRRPQVDAYLDRVPEGERASLADQLMTWLEVAPTPAYDDKTRAEIRSEPVARASIDAMASEAGLWPELLPRLRERASLSVRELAGNLVAAIGLGSNAEPKTSDYLKQLERGSLDPARVSQTVIEKLAGILRVEPSLLDQAGGPTFRPAPMFRAAKPASSGTVRNMEVLADMLTAKAPAEDWDEVDQLFQGGR
jgi:transcriptional regulator with XRE-family HTH domain